MRHRRRTDSRAAPTDACRGHARCRRASAITLRPRTPWHSQVHRAGQRRRLRRPRRPMSKAVRSTRRGASCRPDRRIRRYEDACRRVRSPRGLRAFDQTNSIGQSFVHPFRPVQRRRRSSPAMTPSRWDHSHAATARCCSVGFGVLRDVHVGKSARYNGPEFMLSNGARLPSASLPMNGKLRIVTSQLSYVGRVHSAVRSRSVDESRSVSTPRRRATNTKKPGTVGAGLSREGG